MGFMKSLFGNMGVQQEIPEKKIIIRDVGPNPAQVISIIQNYYPEDADQVSMLVNENMMEGNALRVKTELMLDFEEEEFENFSALHCNNCGAELASGTKFCPKCGTKVEEAQKMFCPQCGNEIMPGAKFCTKCGARCM